MTSASFQMQATQAARSTSIGPRKIRRSVSISGMLITIRSYPFLRSSQTIELLFDTAESLSVVGALLLEDNDEAPHPHCLEPTECFGHLLWSSGDVTFGWR